MSEYVPGEGPGDANFAIVGEAPGSHEDRIGKPFVGPTGDLLEEMLSEVGVHRSEVYLTNVVKYQPPGNDIKKLPMVLMIPHSGIGEMPSSALPPCVMAAPARNGPA